MPTEPSAYGVLYAPDTTAGTAPPKTLDELLTPDIAFVRVQWVDYTNVVRFRVLSAPYFRALFSNPTKTRPGIGVSKVALGIVGISLAPGFGPSGEYLFVPDLCSWRVCTYAPGHASVMGWFQEKSAPRPGAGLEVPMCPRTILTRLVKCVIFFPFRVVGCIVGGCMRCVFADYDMATYRPHKEADRSICEGLILLYAHAWARAYCHYVTSTMPAPPDPSRLRLAFEGVNSRSRSSLRGPVPCLDFRPWPRSGIRMVVLMPTSCI